MCWLLGSFGDGQTPTDNRIVGSRYDDDEVSPAGKANVATRGVLGIEALVVTVLTLVIDSIQTDEYHDHDDFDVDDNDDDKNDDLGQIQGDAHPVFQPDDYHDYDNDGQNADDDNDDNDDDLSQGQGDAGPVVDRQVYEADLYRGCVHVDLEQGDDDDNY